ncbi:penicillin acylase family protein [Trinickia dinghuensis]|uniref:Penicillin acylase family protein n=1 Tax=Trinickia dinghuensis TaxID=2291023 RepID=A0A3D8JS18_9BURK|nr:penicillin acylase family protein [Trinickia dinghuensis]RDU95211.1 penicillin acylase family protein [Trinickia dinghuensis]
MTIALPRRRNALGFTAKCIAAIVTLCALVLLACVIATALSLPALDGTKSVNGLQASVDIARDAQGVPTISGATREDVAYATGFVHAQERFFQMDLLRRSATGQLAALLGPSLLRVDRARRIYGFDRLADQAFAKLPAADKKILERYAAGVNAGLAALRVRPFEYLVLRTSPRPWRPQDSLLVVWSMYFELQEGELHRDFSRGWLREHTSAEALKTLLPECSEWDAPLDAPSVDCGGQTVQGAAPDWLGVAPSQTVAEIPFGTEIGSNNWAISGKRTATGSAIVANDMHLNLRLPNIWYRAVLEYPSSPSGKPRRIVGVTLPGAPVVVAGSNGSVAWGFTNSYGDYLDLVELQIDPEHPDRYRTPTGWAPLRFHDEVLRVNGGAAATMRVAESNFGPVWKVGDKHYAVRWVAQDDGAANLGLLRMEAATDVSQALAVGQSAGIPAQNLVAGDTAGNIGWTIAGPMPQRHADWNDTFPYSSTTDDKGWHSLLPPGDHPSIVNPASGQLWTANARQLAGPDYAAIGDGGADLGARARQIRDDLAARHMMNEAGAYAPSLDDRALFMSTWRDRALRVLDERAVAGHPRRAEFKRLLLERWNGCACIDSVAYRLTRAYLYSLYGELFGEADREMRSLDPYAGLAIATPRWPVVLARLVDQQPANWLPKDRKSWSELELAAVDDAISKLAAHSVALKDATWGQRNTAAIAHPFVSGMPFLARWLAAPRDPLPGDGNMPRVAAPSFGQSERLVVSPGHEDHAIFNMPGGESGHPLSSYFLAGHEAWVHGQPTPLLPGPPKHLLRLNAAPTKHAR